MAKRKQKGGKRQGRQNYRQRALARKTMPVIISSIVNQYNKRWAYGARKTWHVCKQRHCMFCIMSWCLNEQQQWRSIKTISMSSSLSHVSMSSLGGKSISILLKMRITKEGKQARRKQKSNSAALNAQAIKRQK